MRFAFYGRVSTEDQQDPNASHNWQRSRARTLIEPAGGRIVQEFFDVGLSRSLPWKRRPAAALLLAALKNPHRGFDAVVIGEPQRAFYGNQYGLTFPLFVHYGVKLWVPEVGGPIDPDSEAHDLVMSVFGGMSKGERTRIRIRVRAAMGAQAVMEGRFLGGRPPYGYRIVDRGEHPNPGKAATGHRLHGLDLDQTAAAVVERIFTEFLAGHGIYAIAEGLTRDGIACPSAHDHQRNPHRSGIAWSKSAIRVILTNPRYTGFQVWNRQRKQEILLDVDDVALGHETKMRWNDRQAWLHSSEPSHPAIVTVEAFQLAPKTSSPPPHGEASRACPDPPPAPTSCADCCSVACASGGCRATSTTACRTTDAGSPTSTPWPTTSNTPAPCTYGKTRSSPPWTDGWPPPSPQAASRTPSTISPKPNPTSRPHPTPGRWPSVTANSPTTAPPSTPAPTPPSSPNGSPRPKQTRPSPRPASTTSDPPPSDSADNRSNRS